MIDLSVIVVPVDGHAAVAACLHALRAQQEAPELEIIVPFDDTLADLHSLAATFPDVRFLALGPLLPDRPADDFAAQHERIDLRRAAGIAAAGGGCIALLEDRGHPAPTWARTVVEAQREKEGVVGGVIELGVDRALHRAVFLIDFAPYEPPRDAAEVTELSDVNVSYSRRAVDTTRPGWEHGFHEPQVHELWREAGESLRMNPDLRVSQRRGRLSVKQLAAERFHWARLFAAKRFDRDRLGARLLYGLTAPLLPLLLFARIARGQIARGRLLAFAAAAPWVLCLLVPKSLGEAVGYLTARR